MELGKKKKGKKKKDTKKALPGNSVKERKDW